MARTDLEASTFQKRPAYRYIRLSDKLPREYTAGAVARVKVFDPTGYWTWYIASYDPATRMAFGLVDGFLTSVIGYFDMRELVGYRGTFGLPLERDLHWKPKLLTNI